MKASIVGWCAGFSVYYFTQHAWGWFAFGVGVTVANLLEYWKKAA